MRVALVGNMNNNHFAFLRYLHDLGIDAYLFLYKNEQFHFAPKNDTWSIEKWGKYIIQTEMMNGFKGYNFSLLYYSGNKVKKLFMGFDYIIANGSFPIYAHRAGIKVDFFIPYAVGIEFLSLSYKSIKRLVSTKITRKLQSKAINKCVRRIATLDFTKENLLNFNILNKQPIFLGIPMLYNEKPIYLTQEVLAISSTLEAFELVVFSHVSHIWKNIPSQWSVSIKQNNILIEGFSKFVADNPNLALKSRLVLLKYGPDVVASKELIRELGIGDYVIWIPQMARKELMLLIERADFGGGEFGGLLWGGTGWEFMSKGIPFFQFVDCDTEEYESNTGIEFPQIINTNSPSIIARHLSDFFVDKKKYRSMGHSLKDWFEENGGINLVKKYVKILQEGE